MGVASVHSASKALQPWQIMRGDPPPFLWLTEKLLATHTQRVALPPWSSTLLAPQNRPSTTTTTHTITPAPIVSATSPCWLCTASSLFILYQFIHDRRKMLSS